jgi:hypothetical protein
MSWQSWEQVLINAQAAQAGPSNTTTETSVLPTAAKFTIPANFLEIGAVLRLTLIGQMSNVVTTPGTVQFKVKFGSTVAFDCAAQAMSTTAHTTLPHWLDILLTCRAIGGSTSANLIGQGRATGQMCLRSGADLATDGVQMSPNSTPGVGTGFDSTATQQVDVTCTFSTTTATTAYTSQQYILEALN